jgi:hypothetical protein
MLGVERPSDLIKSEEAQALLEENTTIKVEDVL